MTTARLSGAIAVALSVTTGIACRAIPDYRFTDDVADAADASVADAPVDDASPHDDALPPDDGALDGGPDDASTGCPTAPPPFADTCCGSVPCVGDCVTSCSECERLCGVDEVCCAKRTTVICKRKAGFVCN